MTRLELRHERFDDALDESGGLVNIANPEESLRSVCPDLFGGELRITKAYAEGRFALHLHVLWRTNRVHFRDSEQFCAILHASQRAGILTRRTPYPAEYGLYELRHADGRQDHPVLVAIVQSPDGVDVQMSAPRLKVGDRSTSLYRVPSVIWLQLLDACPMPFDHPLQDVFLLPPVLFRVRRDGPGGSIPGPGADRWQGELVDEMDVLLTG